MSFMFNPHPYDDYTPVNRPAISNEIKGRTTFGAEKSHEGFVRCNL